MKYNTVKNFKDLLSIRKDIGDIVYCEEEKRAYTYTDKNVWEPCTISGEGLRVSLFDLNAQAIEQLPAISDEDVEKAKQNILDWSKKVNNEYYMLMCKEQSYYTILKYVLTANPEFTDLADAVITLCKELGELKTIYTNAGNTDFDIWVKVNDDMWCMHLFAYDAGVVYYG